MTIDQEKLAARSWAIPAISALFILHHDFKQPRLAEVFRLIWSESSVDIHFRYGNCNVSGTVIDSIALSIIVHRSGVVEVHPLALDAAPENAVKKHNLLQFLTGEVARETVRWDLDFHAWLACEGVDVPDVGLFGLVCALVGMPVDDMHVQAVKPPSTPGVVQKLRLDQGAVTTTITCFGRDGVTLHVADRGQPVTRVKMHQVQDIRAGLAPVEKGVSRYLKRATSSAGSLLLLPLDLLLYMCEQRYIADMAEASRLVDYLPPPPLVDAKAGESLSALSG